VAKVEAETRLLAARGFRSLLLVAGEHPRHVSNGYVAECIRRCRAHTPQVALELGPLETPAYAEMTAAGAEGLVVYQETYHEPTYRQLHTAGPKKHFGWRLDTPERGYAAGFRRLGIGALFGLHDWREEAVALAAHAQHLRKHCWRSYLTVALPRLRPAAGGFQVSPENALGDRDLAQLLCALRLFLPTAGLVLSTREPPHLRDGLCALGVTHMSAGSCTEPGGYSHFDEDHWTPTRAQPGEQFHIADERPPDVVAAMLRARGLEPVWKDHDLALVPDAPAPGTITATSGAPSPILKPISGQDEQDEQDEMPHSAVQPKDAGPLSCKSCSSCLKLILKRNLVREPHRHHRQRPGSRRHRRLRVARIPRTPRPDPGARGRRAQRRGPHPRRSPRDRPGRRRPARNRPHRRRRLNAAPSHFPHVRRQKPGIEKHQSGAG
jgi:2-iminoacetate synthase